MTWFGPGQVSLDEQGLNSTIDVACTFSHNTHGAFSGVECAFGCAVDDAHVFYIWSTFGDPAIYGCTLGGSSGSAFIEETSYLSAGIMNTNLEHAGDVITLLSGRDNRQIGGVDDSFGFNVGYWACLVAPQRVLAITPVYANSGTVADTGADIASLVWLLKVESDYNLTVLDRQLLQDYYSGYEDSGNGPVAAKTRDNEVVIGFPLTSSFEVATIRTDGDSLTFSASVPTAADNLGYGGCAAMDVGKAMMFVDDGWMIIEVSDSGVISVGTMTDPYSHSSLGGTLVLGGRDYYLDAFHLPCQAPDGKCAVIIWENFGGNRPQVALVEDVGGVPTVTSFVPVYRESDPPTISYQMSYGYAFTNTRYQLAMDSAGRIHFGFIPRVFSLVSPYDYVVTDFSPRITYDVFGLNVTAGMPIAQFQDYEDGTNNYAILMLVPIGTLLTYGIADFTESGAYVDGVKGGAIFMAAFRYSDLAAGLRDSRAHFFPRTPVGAQTNP